MKSIKNRILPVLLAALLLVSLLSACGTDEAESVSPSEAPGLTVGGELSSLSLELLTNPKQAEKIEPSSPDVNIPVGATTPLAVVFTPEEPLDKELLWASSDQKIATVSPTGAATGVREGQCTITATYRSNPALSAVFNISVGISLENAVSDTDYFIAVYLGSQSVCVYTKNSAGAFTVLQKVMTCSSGVSGKGTITGDYSITAKYRWRALVGGSYGQYCSSLGKNNYLFHSVPYAYQAPNTLKMNEYRKLGKKASQGCIRLCVADVKWIYDNIPIHTAVLITEASGPKGGAVRPLNTDAAYSGWDPTDPSTENPYINPSMLTPISVELNESFLSMTVGEKKTLTAATSGASNRYISWYSTDEQVATVTQSGQITAKKAGSATIIAQVGDAKASCTVRVLASSSSKPATSKPVSSSKPPSSSSSSAPSSEPSENPSSDPDSSDPTVHTAPGK